MTFPLTHQQIADATMSNYVRIFGVWPLFVQALKAKGIDAGKNIPAVVALAATIGCECHFEPKHEIGNKAYFDRMYGKRADYELDDKGMWKWRGRGYIQLTGKANYEKYGRKIGVDLIANPDAALQPENAVKLAVEYLHDHGCFTWAQRGHWLEIRYAVNGRQSKQPNGMYRWPNGWEHYNTYVYNLLSAAYA